MSLKQSEKGYLGVVLVWIGGIIGGLYLSWMSYILIGRSITMIEGFYLIAAGVLFYYLVRTGLRLLDKLATKLEERKGAKYQKKEH